MIRRALSKIFQAGTAAANRRRYEGASGGRRWHDSAVSFGSNQSGLHGGPQLRARARHLTANNPHAAKGLDTLTTALVGTGIKPQSAVEDPDLRRAHNQAFERWTDSADIDALGDFYAMTAGVAAAMVRDGEALVILETDRDAGALRLRQIAAEQLDASVTRELPDRGRIIAGVEFDASGRRVAYHILPDAQDLPFMRQLEPVRVLAADVLHIFERRFAGQVRGVSWFAPVLLRLAELDKTEDAQIVRQQIGALLTGFVTDSEGGMAGFTGEQDGSNLEGGLEPGTLKVLRPGQDVRFSDPPEIGAEANEFIRLQLRGIAAGLGITYEQLTGDYSSTNYSSARAALIEFRRRIEAVQNHVLVFQFCRPVWQRWLTLEMLAGRLNAPGFESDPDRYLVPRWITPGWAWVDPQKEISAQKEAVEAGFMSRREVVAGRGLDIEALDAERAADAVREPRPEEEAA